MFLRDVEELICHSDIWIADFVYQEMGLLRHLLYASEMAGILGKGDYWKGSKNKII